MKIVPTWHVVDRHENGSSVTMAAPRATLVADVKASLGESPVWHERTQTVWPLSWTCLASLVAPRLLTVLRL